MAEPVESADWRSTYRAQTRDAAASAARILLVVLLAAAPVFVIVDWLLFPRQFPILLAQRVAGSAVTAILLAILASHFGRRHVVGIVLLASALGGMGILGMMSLTGGTESPYFTGLGLIILGVGLLMPWPWWCNVLVVLIVLVLYVASAAAGGVGSHGVWSSRAMAHVLAIGGTGLVAVLAGHAREKLRRREFEARWSLQLSLAELDRTMQRLAHASELKSEFVATMSHELRTPLNLVLGYTEMARDTDDLADCQRYVSRIQKAGYQLVELVEETLAVAQIDSSGTDLKLETIALPDFWRELGDRCRSLPRQAAVVLEWQSAVPALSLRTDPRKLTVVLRNLVGNALKYTGEGRVTARVGSNDAHVRFEVVDTGVGIPREAQTEIFDRYRRLAATSDHVGGIGLGLYIVRRLVRELGGAVEVQSEVGRGSTFAVTLPWSPSGAEHRAPPVRSDAQLAGRP